MARYDGGYDYGLRGFRDTAPRRPQVQTHFVGGGYPGEDPREIYRREAAARRRPAPYGGDYRGGGWQPMTNRVTARYNMDYVREQHPGEYPMNPYPYGGDREGRVGDFRQYNRPYHTVSGSNTSRGGGQPVGWERTSHRYDYLYRNRGDGGYDHRWF